MRHTPTVVALLTLCSTAAAAQTNATKPPVPHRQVLSTDPLGMMFNWFSADYERKVGAATTLGVSASHVGELDYTNAALVARWYPQRAALDGFYLGARAAAVGIETYDYDNQYVPQPVDPNRRTYPTYTKRVHVMPGVGIDIGYNWLLGPKQNLSVGLGFGVTRLLGTRDRFDDVMAVPNMKLVNIGFAF